MSISFIAFAEDNKKVFFPKANEVNTQVNPLVTIDLENGKFNLDVHWSRPVKHNLTKMGSKYLIEFFRNVNWDVKLLPKVIPKGYSIKVFKKNNKMYLELAIDPTIELFNKGYELNYVQQNSRLSITNPNLFDVVKKYNLKKLNPTAIIANEVAYVPEELEKPIDVKVDIDKIIIKDTSPIAAFRRYDKIFIIMATNKSFDWPKIKRHDFIKKIDYKNNIMGNNKIIGKLVVLDVNKFVTLNIKKTNEQYELHLIRRITPIDNTVTLDKSDQKIEFALGDARVLKFKDPYLHEDMIAVATTYNRNNPYRQTFVDFTMEGTLQGVVIQPFNDKLEVEALNNKVTISIKDKKLLVSNLPKTYPLNISILNINKFIQDVNWLETRRKLEENVRKNKGLDSLYEANIDLALFYLTNNNVNEAVSMLDFIAKENPTCQYKQEWRYLKVVSLMLSKNLPEALETAYQRGVRYTREVKALMPILELIALGNSLETGFNALKILEHYPTNIMKQIAFIGAEAAYKYKLYGSIKPFLEVLNTVTLNEAEKRRFEFLIAYAISSNDGDMLTLNKLREMSNDTDPYSKAVIDLAKVELELKNNLIKIEKAIEIILDVEKRGYPLDNHNQLLLAELYIKGNHPFKAIDILEKLIKDESLEISKNAKKNLITSLNKVMLEDKFFENNELKSLGLIMRYIKMLKTNQPLINKITSRMESIGLYDEALAFLEKYYKQEDQGVHIKKIVLALQANNSKKAIELLENSEKQHKISGLELVDLKAKAYLQDNQSEKAVTLLEGYLLEYPDNIKVMHQLAEIYSNQEKWPQAYSLWSRIISGLPSKFDRRKYILSNQRIEGRTALQEAIASGTLSNSNIVKLALKDQYFEPNDPLVKIVDVLSDYQPLGDSDHLKAQIEKIITPITSNLLPSLD